MNIRLETMTTPPNSEKPATLNSPMLDELEREIKTVKSLDPLMFRTMSNDETQLRLGDFDMIIGPFGIKRLDRVNEYPF